jgi:hypothetical protein
VPRGLRRRLSGTRMRSAGPRHSAPACVKVTSRPSEFGCRQRFKFGRRPSRFSHMALPNGALEQRAQNAVIAWIVASTQASEPTVDGPQIIATLMIRSRLYPVL